MAAGFLSLLKVFIVIVALIGGSSVWAKEVLFDTASESPSDIESQFIFKNGDHARVNFEEGGLTMVLDPGMPGDGWSIRTRTYDGLFSDDGSRAVTYSATLESSEGRNRHMSFFVRMGKQGEAFRKGYAIVLLFDRSNAIFGIHRYDGEETISKEFQRVSVPLEDVVAKGGTIPLRIEVRLENTESSVKISASINGGKLAETEDSTPGAIRSGEGLGFLSHDNGQKTGIQVTYKDISVVQEGEPVAKAQSEATDVFEKIAQVKNEAVPNVAPNPAPRLPNINLPWDAQPKTPFVPGEKITAQAQLDTELEKMRAKYAPFMADLAPALASFRPTLDLTSFSWRYETPEDIKDPSQVKRGAGEWEKVSIPHYGGPVNDATAYYRAEINLDSRMLALPQLMVHFQAVDYLADVSINGHHLGSHEGLFDSFEYDIKPYVKPGMNVLVVKVRNEAIQMGDNMNLNPRAFGKKFAACGGPGWDEPGKGWHMCPPGFGIWQRAWLEARPAASVKDIFVRPIPHNNQAEIWLEVAQTNDAPVTVSYSLYGQNFKAVLTENKVEDAQPQASPDGTKLYKFTIPFTADQLRWWTPDEPWLYQLQVKLSLGGKVVDARKKQFGMRTFTQSVTSTPKGRFYLNGKEVRLRGANMMGNLMQCVIRGDFDQLRDDILLAKLANMNFWRMTQQPCQEEVYDYFDRLGMMAQTDLPVFVGIWREQAEEGLRQAEAMEKLVRSHPSNVIITYINEPIFDFGGGRSTMLPRAELTALFERFDNAVLAINPDQVIKWVDGDYANISSGYSDHHCYSLWYKGHAIDFRAQYTGAWMPTPAGWMHGCGEFGAEGLDSVALMKKYYPKEWTQTGPNGTWSPAPIPRNQTERMGPDWFGFRPEKMEEWVETSQNHQMWAVRLMSEALRRDPKMNSFAIHLLIDAWPAGWMKSIMSYDRQAKPAYFAYRDALTPLSVNLRPDRFYAFSGESVRIGAWVCNDTTEVHPGAMLRYQVKLGSQVVLTGFAPAKIAICEPEFEGFLKFPAPSVNTRQPMTVQLGLFAADGKLLHDTTQTLDLFPATEKPVGDTPPAGAGGHPQRLL